MARIAGVDLPNNKRTEISLTYIFGIGRSTARKICEESGVGMGKKAKDLSEEEIYKLRNYIEKNVKVEGELRSEITMNIKRLKDIRCYRGIRHIRKLPIRGQRTRTNARTVKGAKKTVAKKKK
ncbi:MAG: 30S ribosomal protein S13 [Spirochaetota bacterium]